MNARDEAVAAGMTPAEADAWVKVADAARACLDLTQTEPGHGMEREEMCHAFHSIQGWLSSRPWMRSLRAAADEAEGDER